MRRAPGGAIPLLLGAPERMPSLRNCAAKRVAAKRAASRTPAVKTAVVADDGAVDAPDPRQPGGARELRGGFVAEERVAATDQHEVAVQGAVGAQQLPRSGDRGGLQRRRWAQAQERGRGRKELLDRGRNPYDVLAQGEQLLAAVHVAHVRARVRAGAAHVARDPRLEVGFVVRPGRRHRAGLRRDEHDQRGQGPRAHRDRNSVAEPKVRLRGNRSALQT